jgi:hypothetical protein
MWVTSTWEVFVPSALKLIVVYLDNLLDLFKLTPRQLDVICQLDVRLQPELRLPIPAIHMNVHSRLFTGEEKESITLLAKYCRTHMAIMIAQNPLGDTLRFSTREARAVVRRMGGENDDW